MKTYHEGQEVEVDFTQNLKVFGHDWHKAKIVRAFSRITDLDDGSRLMDTDPSAYEVEFPGGMRGVFDEKYIRVAST